MSQAFGRKRVGPIGAEAPMSMRVATGVGPDDGLSPEARAFLAAERARRTSASPTSDMELVAPLAQRRTAGSPRSLILAYVLWWFASPLAAHRFYLGATRSALAMLFLFWGGLAVAGMMSSQSSLWLGGIALPPLGIIMILAWLAWCLLDAFLIPGLRRRAEHPWTDRLGEVFA